MSDVEQGDRDNLVALNHPISVVSDRYRMLFAKVDQICRAPGKKVIALTSAIKGEGKTTTAANLAIVCARDFGKRCLVMDGDFRNPTLAKRFGMTEELGLSEVVADKCRLGGVIRKGPIPNLTILTMGQRSPLEKNIWTSEKMANVMQEVRGWFDYIWVDAPPILPLFDMSLISESVDGILVVVRAGEVPEQVLTQAVKSLGTSKVIGSILNGAKMDWPSRYYGYGY